MSELHKYFWCPVCEVHSINDNSLQCASFFMSITILRNSVIILHRNTSKLSRWVL